MMTTEEEMDRLRDVIWRWGRVLVAKGLADPQEIIAGYEGTGDGIRFARLSEAQLWELSELHRPFRRIGVG
jgi:protein involved in temperature-dependent protein secretion